MFQEYLKELNKVDLLTQERERELWVRYKEHGDTDSRKQIIEAYQPLVFRIVNHFSVNQDIIMDLIQEGTVGLIEAVEGFDHMRNARFSTYAQYRIRGRVLNFLERCILQGQISLNYSASTDGGDPVLLEKLEDRTTLSVDEEVEKRFLHERVYQAMERLPGKEQRIVNAIYLEDALPHEVAKELKISTSYVYKLQKKAIRRMRGMLSRFIGEMKAGAR